jgi:hypothetical protein
MSNEIKETTEEKDPLVRIAEAVEKLAADPEVEIEVGPPVCPSCGKLNPSVTLPAQEGGQGLMSEIIVNGHCNECGAPFFIVIESYSLHMMSSTAVSEINARTKAGMFTDEQH